MGKIDRETERRRKIDREEWGGNVKERQREHERKKGRKKKETDRQADRQTQRQRQT